MPEDAPFYFKDYHNYYKTPRGYHERSLNSNGGWNMTSAQIILRWQLQADYIVIPGSSNPNHIAENYNIFDFELSSEDMKMITNLNKNER